MASVTQYRRGYQKKTTEGSTNALITKLLVFIFECYIFFFGPVF